MVIPNKAYRPSLLQVIARQWTAHGDHREVRPLTGWEKMWTSGAPHSTADLGMLVVGNEKTVVHPGDWIVRMEDDLLMVMSNDEFQKLYVSTSLDPTLQELVDSLTEFRDEPGRSEETVKLIDDAITGLYLQAEIISKCYAEKYQYETRILPRKR